MKKKAITLIAIVALAMSAQAASIKTDREWYVAGEPIRVNITEKDALIAYAELCDTYGLAAGTVVNVKSGEGKGIIELPQNLHSGYYVLNVYTRHNAKVDNKLIAIVNPLHKSADDDMEWIEADRCFAQSKGTAELTNKKGIDVRETEGHIIKAKVKNTYEGQKYAAREICPAMSVIGKQVKYFEGKMINDSIAVFYTYDIHGKQAFVLSATTSTGVSLPIEMISPFEALAPKKLPHLVFNYKRSEVEERSLAMQRYQLGKPTELEPTAYDDEIHGTKPELSYNLDEYRQFLTVREVLLEYVSSVTRKKINGVQKLVVFRDLEHYNSILPSLVLIDGMPVMDTEKLLRYDARRVHHINIYSNQYTFGNNAYSGILSFVTRSGKLTNYPIERNMQYLEYEFPE